MTNWKERVKFKDLLPLYDEDAEDELAEIERVKPLWIKRFSVLSALRWAVPSLKKVKTESQFNKWLSRVYDYCDADSIWVE